MVERRLLPDTTKFRLFQIAGWKLDERGAEFRLRPDSWDVRSQYGAYFAGRIEASNSGSQITGFVREGWLVQVIANVLLAAFAAVLVASFRENHWTLSREVARVVAALTIMAASLVLLLQISLRVTDGMIRDGIALAQTLSPGANHVS